MEDRRLSRGFTLIELLAVILIIGVVAGLSMPILSSFRKGDAMLTATRQMLDAVHRGRQLAISQHTTVYMVFAPPEFWGNTFYPNAARYNVLPVSEIRKATNIFDKQLTGYIYIALRAVGDQPGSVRPRYLTSWQTLPESTFIPSWKFFNPGQTRYVGNFQVTTFNIINNLPFPAAETQYVSPAPYIWLPYIAFNYLGQLIAPNGDVLAYDEFIPLAHGSVSYARDLNTKALQMGPVAVLESPQGNSTNVSFNLVHIDRLTGRARLERQEVQ